MTFDLTACRFHLAARDSIHFRPGQTGNILRGALASVFRNITCAEHCPGRTGANIRDCPLRSSCAYARIFEPAAVRTGQRGAGPSGLSDWPRPFVIRAASLDGQRVEPGEQFCVGVNLFETLDASIQDSAVEHFQRAFAEWAEIVSVEQRMVNIDLTPRSIPVSRIRVEFQSPTDLKAAGNLGKADFSALLARARDRVGTLSSLYGAGPLAIDFRGLSERARSVKVVNGELGQVSVERRSSRTGQRHSIGGLTGFVEYDGNLTEFLPYLEAGSWTGVGRHCTWGNGQIATTILNSEF